MRALFAIVLLAVCLGATPYAPARAQQADETAGGSFLTPFPQGDIYKMQVFGDAWAGGLLEGLVEALGGDQRVNLQRKHRMIQGVNRNEFDDDLRALEDTLAKEPIHVAVVMLGQADRTSVRIAGQSRRAQVGSEEWRSEYGRRLDRLIRVLKKNNVGIYWVGLPTLRRADAHEDAQLMNEIIRERASLNGMRYIDAFGGFASEAGGYDNYGPDITGKIRVLREPDGVGFTAVGYRKLAHFVEREVKRDIQQAQSERSIPLAGSETEQQKVNPAKAQAEQAAAAAAAAASATQPKAAAPTAGWQGTVSGPRQGGMATQGAAAAQGSEGFGEQKADHGRIALKQIGQSGREETVTLEILRPALASTVIAAVTRRESADKASQMGDSINDDLPNGLTAVASITPANETSAGGRRRIAASQTPYFRVLVKGERLAPKPGRADDQIWPRPGPEPLSAAPQPASAQSTDQPARKGTPAGNRRAPAEPPAKAPRG